MNKIFLYISLALLQLSYTLNAIEVASETDSIRKGQINLSQNMFVKLLETNPDLESYALNLNKNLQLFSISLNSNYESSTDFIKMEIQEENGFFKKLLKNIIIQDSMEEIYNAFIATLNITSDINRKYCNKLAEELSENPVNFTEICNAIKNFKKYCIRLEEIIDTHDKYIKRFQELRIDELKEQEKQQKDLAVDKLNEYDTFLHKFFSIHMVENFFDICKMHLPLINGIMGNKKLCQHLKRHEPDLYKNADESLKIYNNSNKKLDQHHRRIDSDYNKFINTAHAITAPSNTANTSRSTPQNTKSQRKHPRQNKHQRNHQPAPSSSAQTPVETALSSENNLSDWLMEYYSSHQSSNLKSEYRGSSAQELTRERKAKAKEQKRQQSPNTPPEQNAPEETTGFSMPDVEKFKLDNGYDVFVSIMENTYKGEMAPVTFLIINRFHGRAHLSHGRWHFAIPHINCINGIIFSTTFDPLPNEEEEQQESAEAVQDSSNDKNISLTKTTIHNPHKNRSKRLRPYHIKDLRQMFEEAGYTLETVER